MQLGDSYSAGDGAGSYVGRDSWRSPANYGARVAEQLRATYDNVACSGGVVFLTVGGNDIGFTGIVVQCMVLRSPVGCQGSVDVATARIPKLKQDTMDALTAVSDRTNGRPDVSLLGYPFLLSTDSYGIPEGAPTYDAGAALHQMQLAGDRAQEEARAELDATTRGPGDFTFVDVKPTWGSHTHGLDPHIAPDNSDAWLVPVLAPGRQLSEWVHPTTDGSPPPPGHCSRRSTERMGG